MEVSNPTTHDSEENTVFDQQGEINLQLTTTRGVAIKVEVFNGVVDECGEFGARSFPREAFEVYTDWS